MQRKCIAIAAAALASGGLLLGLFRQRKRKITLVNYYKTLYYEQQANGALINAHFVFNALGSLQHFIRNYPADTANAYVSDLASLIRMKMESSRDPFVSIREEIKNTRAYLKIEKQRLGDQLRYEMHIDGNVDTMTMIPGMILQPFIENAIWHGIMPLSRTGTVAIHLSKPNDTTIKIRITDDGVGIYTGRNNKASEGKSLGISLVKERLDILKQLTMQHYDVSICETSGDIGVTGTSVLISLPAHPEMSVFDQLDS